MLSEIYSIHGSWKLFSLDQYFCKYLQIPLMLKKKGVRGLKTWKKECKWEKHCKGQFSSVAQSCPTLCNSTDCSMPGLPVLHYLPEFTQTHAHWVGDAIQPSHPLWSPSPPTFQSFPASGSFPVSQFFTSGGQSIRVSASASVLPVNIQDWFPLGVTGFISLQSRGLSRVFYNTTVQKHQFFSAQLSLWSNSHIHTWLLEKP